MVKYQQFDAAFLISLTLYFNHINCLGQENGFYEAKRVFCLPIVFLTVLFMGITFRNRFQIFKRFVVEITLHITLRKVEIMNLIISVK